MLSLLAARHHKGHRDGAVPRDCRSHRRGASRDSENRFRPARRDAVHRHAAASGLTAPRDEKLSRLKTEFARGPTFCHCSNITATHVIEEIKHLPRAEQSRVIQFAFELARERQLSGKELTALAQRMADSDDPAEVEKLKS